jgi:hypothetical protein
VRRRVLAALAALLLVTLAVPGARAATPAGDEEQRIDYLIRSIETLAGAQFIRNGTAYDATAAAAHLRLKRQKAGSHVVTAADFIRDCASRSSVSGEPYRIRYADGHEVTAESFLRARLAAYVPAAPGRPLAMRLHGTPRFGTVGRDS